MRLAPEAAGSTIAAAVDAGATLFDTARAYGDNESVVARALRACGAEASARVVTKGGMARVGDGWVPDGRARSLLADCEASLAALDGLPIDLYLIHAPDPRTPWRTSVRALARLVDDGLVRRVGVSNVNRRLLDEALELAPISAVEVPLSPFDVGALRGGVVERCAELGLTVIAHSPLGGPRRAGSLARRPGLVAVAQSHGATPAQVALAWLLALAPGVVPIPGARRPETARAAARAASLELDEAEIATLDEAFAVPRARSRRRTRTESDVVLVMGIPGAGKSRVADRIVARGYGRLNRDEAGGSLRGLASMLDEALAKGDSRIVLDNTYLTRASRSWVVEVAGRHRARVRCVWLDTPLAQAQVNLVERLLDRFGHLPTPDELRSAARREPGLLAPTSQMRAVRELEPPDEAEGFAEIERIEFVREARDGASAIFVAASAVRAGWEPTGHAVPHLLFDWIPDGGPEALADLTPRLPVPLEVAVCPHGGGPPTCWCRPPLPGLPLAFARVQGVDPARSTLVGTSAAHRRLAANLASVFVSAE